MMQDHFRKQLYLCPAVVKRTETFETWSETRIKRLHGMRFQSPACNEVQDDTYPVSSPDDRPYLLPTRIRCIPFKYAKGRDAAKPKGSGFRRVCDQLIPDCVCTGALVQGVVKACIFEDLLQDACVREIYIVLPGGEMQGFCAGWIDDDAAHGDEGADWEMRVPSECESGQGFLAIDCVPEVSPVVEVFCFCGASVLGHGVHRQSDEADLAKEEAEGDWREDDLCECRTGGAFDEWNLHECDCGPGAGAV